MHLFTNVYKGRKTQICPTDEEINKKEGSMVHFQAGP
jgi:hypothetical protein